MNHCVLCVVLVDGVWTDWNEQTPSHAVMDASDTVSITLGGAGGAAANAIDIDDSDAVNALSGSDRTALIAKMKALKKKMDRTLKQLA